MRAYSLDLRERVVRAVRERGQTPTEAARAFEVRVWTVKRYLRRAEEGPLADPRARPRDRPGAGGGAGDAVARGGGCPAGGSLRHLGGGAGHAGEPRDDGAGGRAPGPVAQEKTLVAGERDEAARDAWRDAVSALAPADFVFVDACGTHVALTPLYAWAPRGERAHGAVPRNRGQNRTLVAALTAAGCAAAMTLDGAADGPAFEAYARAVLVPTLRPGQVVILDNRSVHKGATTRALVEEAGCTLLFLPPSSPDCNPIERAFSTRKAHLRRAGARTRAALEAAIAAALDTLSPADARAWFALAGYRLPPAPSNLSTT